MRAFDFEYLVDDVPMLVPDAAVEVTLEDLQAGDAGMDEAGYFHPRPLRQGMRQWDFSYGVVSGQEYGYLLSLFIGKSSFTFRFRGENGQPEQALCYATGCKGDFYDRKQNIFKNVKFSVKEC